MFGLMRSRTCALGPDEKLRRRLHYCGTCKSIGSRYGQSARLLLNFDSVFAAEVLTAVAGIDAPDNWDSNFHSTNCFRLPSEDAIPEPVRYAAAMTVVLAEVKVADHVDDGRGIAWRALRRGLSPGFRRASLDLAERWSFPVDDLWAHVRRQSDVERAALACFPSTPCPENVLRACAEPTAAATALAFRHAAVAISRPDAASSLHTLGSHFGSVIYILDAIRDVAEDAKAGTFNAVSAAFGVKGDRLPIDVRRSAVRVLRSAQSDLETAIGRLPISAERASLFIDRVRTNVDRAVGSRRLPVLASSPMPEPAITCSRSRVSFSARVRHALSIARAASARHFASCKPLPVRVAEAPFVFALASLAAIVAPVAVSEAASPREILDALFNVAAIGGTLAMAMPPIGSGLDPTASTRRRPQKGEAGGDSGDSSAECCCDCCDGCCGADAHCGSCGSCDACNCCGDGSCCSGCGDCGDCCHCSNSCGDCDCGDCCSCDCN